MNQKKSLDEMNLIDNFLFGITMDNEETGPLLAETILKTIFHRDIHIKTINSEKVFWPPSGKEGNPPQDLQILLKYFADTRQDNACTPELIRIHNGVELIKRDPSIWRQFMDWKEYIEREHQEAAAEEKERADAERKRADSERKRADSEQERADLEKQRADAAEAEVLRLRILLKNRGTDEK